MTKVDGSELGTFQDAKPACIFRIVDSEEKHRYFLSERTNLVYTEGPRLTRILGLEKNWVMRNSR